MAQWVKVNNIRCYAYHGCLPSETQIGGWYEVDVHLQTDFSIAAEHDELSKTIDYVDVNTIVVEEMAQPSKLVETVLVRIRKRIDVFGWKLFQGCIRIRKISPPIGGDVSHVELEENWIVE